MNDIKRPINSHKAYHAHVYFDSETLAYAKSLCEKAGITFGVKVGRVHEKLVGPHPKWSCQITFGASQFDELIPWFDENRRGLTVLVHALTGNDLEDHTDYAYWLGDSLTLDLSLFNGS